MDSPRIFPFDGDDIDYKKYLEQTLLDAHVYFSQLVPLLHLVVNPPPIPQSLAASEQIGSNLSSLPTFPATIRSTSPAIISNIPPSSLLSGPNSRKKPLTSSSFGIIHFDPSNIKQKSTNPREGNLRRQEQNSPAINLRCQKELKKFLSDIPETWDKLERVPLIEINQMLVSPEFPNLQTVAADPNEVDLLELRSWSNMTYLYACNTYRGSNAHSLVGRALKFRNLTVASTSAVMERTGDTDTANMLLKSCLGDLDEVTLRQYRIAAVCINQCISELASKKWGDAASELFYRFGRSLGSYSVLAQNKKSFQELISTLMERKIPLPSSAKPISIPCIIKWNAGEHISLQTICRVLKYEYEDIQKVYDKHYECGKEYTTPISDGAQHEPQDSAKSRCHNGEKTGYNTPVSNGIQSEATSGDEIINSDHYDIQDNSYESNPCENPTLHSTEMPTSPETQLDNTASNFRGLYTLADAASRAGKRPNKDTRNDRHSKRLYREVSPNIDDQNPMVSPTQDNDSLTSGPDLANIEVALSTTGNTPTPGALINTETGNYIIKTNALQDGRNQSISEHDKEIMEAATNRRLPNMVNAEYTRAHDPFFGIGPNGSPVSGSSHNESQERESRNDNENTPPAYFFDWPEEHEGYIFHWPS
ncbi:hypothetical protein FQN57_002460 [Myotisia sp. PD_48]|nr:hypothetical protein FQN57_002460 [Myotisia sp. PD_48]